jgi:hypothetical protein
MVRHVRSPRSLHLASFLILGWGSLACARAENDIPPLVSFTIDPTLCGSGVYEHRVYADADLLAATRLSLDTTRQLTIGGTADGDPYDLSRVRRIAMASPTVALLSTSSPAGVLWADALTNEMTPLAGEGEGPGEVRDVGGVVVRGADSIGLFDAINARVSWFSFDRRLLGSTSLLSPAGAPVLFSTGVALAGVLPGGRLAVSDVQILSSGREAGGAERWRSTARVDVVRLVDDSTGSVGSRSLELPHLDMAMRTQETPEGTVRFPIPVRFSRSAFAGVVGERLVLSTPDGDGFIFCDRMDGTASAVQLAIRPRQIQPGMIGAAVTAESLLAERPSREARLDKAALYAGLKARPVASTLPIVYRAFAASTVLWVIEAYAPPDSSWSATAFSGDGALLGRIADLRGIPPFAMEDSLAIFRDVAEDGTVSFRVVPVEGLGKQRN